MRRTGRTTWPEFWHMRSIINRGKEEEEDPLATAQKYANLESTGLDIAKKRRELQGPSPRDKYMEEQRSGQVGSALAMFGDLYKTASPASKKRLAEQLTSLWGLMTPADQTKFKMMASHTPINPRVQKGMWFEEANPRPRMPIIKEGDGSWTNNPPRTPEYSRLWAEYDIASDEWNTLRGMAVEGKTLKEKGWKEIPKFYDSGIPGIKWYRDSIDKEIKQFDFNKVDQAKMGTALEKGWATPHDIMENGLLPISAPREYVHNGRPVTVTQMENLMNGDTRLDYKGAGPPEAGKEAPKELTDAVALIDSGISPATLKVKSPSVIGYYSQLKNIVKADGRERLGLQLDLQRSIVAKYPSDQRYIPFVPQSVNTGFWHGVQSFMDKVPLVNWVIPTPTVGGEGGNVLLVQADRLVDFYDKNGKANKVWWSDISQVAFDTDGIPIMITQGVEPGSTLDTTWE